MKRFLFLLLLVFAISFVSADPRCEDPNDVWCGETDNVVTCGPTQGWCDNQDSGSSCKPNDPDWCCFDAGYVYCGGDTCGPDVGWCQNWESEGISCERDGSACCDFAGDVYAYGTYICCPPLSPWYDSQSDRCYGRTKDTENWYTDNAECQFGETSCQGTATLVCDDHVVEGYRVPEWEVNGITAGMCGAECNIGGQECIGFDSRRCTGDGLWGSLGLESGVCGVSCTQDIGCGVQGGIIGDDFCEGNQVKRTMHSETCDLSTYQCAGIVETNVTVETCTHSCTGGVCDSDPGQIQNGDVPGITVEVYELMNDNCIKKSKLQSELGSNDYTTLTSCLNQIILTPEQVQTTCPDGSFVTDMDCPKENFFINLWKAILDFFSNLFK